MQDTMTSAVTIERCSPRDPEATALITASHAFLLSKYPPEFSFALSIDDLCVPSIRFWTARIGGAARGCVALADKGDYGELKSMYVDPAARGAGIGAGERTFSHGSEEGADITTVTGMTNEGQFGVKLSGHVNLEEESFLL